MPSTAICCTLFAHCFADELAENYEALAEPANGYLIRLNQWTMLDDAEATETADWSRQIELATMLTCEDGVAVSIFVVGEGWAIAVSLGGQPGPIAAFAPDEHKAVEQLPFKLLAVENALMTAFPDDVDAERVDAIFGAMIDQVMTAEEGMTEIVEMLGCPSDWSRWGWYETIPEQLFTDPDLAHKVRPLGEAKHFWEE